MKTMEKSYHISKGADDVYWILNCGESFVKNLSKDFDTAVAKAKEYIGDNQDIPVDVWHRAKQYFNTEKKPLQHNAHVDSYYEYLYQLEFESKKIECEARQFVGEVGDILEMQLELIETFSFESDYGYCSCYRFKDQNGNRFVYFGTSQEANCFQNAGDKHTISFQIKRQFIDQQHYEKDGVVPFKVNQITKIKTNAPKIKYEVIQFPYSEVNISEIWVEYISKKEYKFYYINNNNEKILFYPKNIKSFKQAKELLYSFQDLDSEKKLTEEYLLNFKNN